MTSIHPPHSFGVPNHRRPVTRPRARTQMPAADYQQLRRHLEECEQSKDPAWRLLAIVIRNKIKMSDPVSGVRAHDLVTGGSYVTYSVNRGAGQTSLLAHRARLGSGINVIPVSSLLGATLIGMKVGQRAPLLFENGAIKLVTVLAISRST